MLSRDFLKESSAPLLRGKFPQEFLRIFSRNPSGNSYRLPEGILPLTRESLGNILGSRQGVLGHHSRRGSENPPHGFSESFARGFSEPPWGVLRATFSDPPGEVLRSTPGSEREVDPRGGRPWGLADNGAMSAMIPW